MDEQKNIPLLDCPVDYLIGDASGKVMNEYGRFPCKIKCGVYAILVRGSARATINISQYEFQQNDVRAGQFPADTRVFRGRAGILRAVFFLIYGETGIQEPYVADGIAPAFAYYPCR